MHDYNQFLYLTDLLMNDAIIFQSFQGASNSKVCLVTPVYNDPVLSGHPLLRDQFLKSRLFVTYTRCPHLLSGRGHPIAVLRLSFFGIFTGIKLPPWTKTKPHAI